jgi:hypothetical protein
MKEYLLWEKQAQEHSGAGTDSSRPKKKRQHDEEEQQQIAKEVRQSGEGE